MEGLRRVQEPEGWRAAALAGSVATPGAQRAGSHPTTTGTAGVRRSSARDHHGLVRGLSEAGATPAGVPEVSVERDVRASSGGSLRHRKGGIGCGKCGPWHTLAFRGGQTAASGRVSAPLPARHPRWQHLFVLLCRGEDVAKCLGKTLPLVTWVKPGWEAWGTPGLSKRGHQALHTGGPLAIPGLVLIRCGHGRFVLCCCHRLARGDPKSCQGRAAGFVPHCLVKSLRIKHH